MHRTNTILLLITLASCATTLPVHPAAKKLIADCRAGAGNSNRCPSGEDLPFHPTRLVDANLCEASQAMARAYIQSDAFSSFTETHGRLPTLVSTRVSNKTDEKFDSKALLTWFERTLLESGCSTVRDPSSDTDADLTLRGLVSDSVEKKTNGATGRSIVFEAILTAEGNESWRGKYRSDKTAPPKDAPTW